MDMCQLGEIIEEEIHSVILLYFSIILILLKII